MAFVWWVVSMNKEDAKKDETRAIANRTRMPHLISINEKVFAQDRWAVTHSFHSFTSSPHVFERTLTVVPQGLG